MYTNFSKVSSKDGYSIGTAGHEANVIDGIGNVTIGGTKINATDRVVKVAKVALGVADTGGGVFAWANPESVSIVIERIVIDVTTASTGACTIDVGTTAVSATTLSDNLIDGLDTNTAIGTFDNITDKGSNGKSRQKLASGKWVTASRASGAAAGTAGFAYIHYILV